MAQNLADYLTAHGGTCEVEFVESNGHRTRTTIDGATGEANLYARAKSWFCTHYGTERWDNNVEQVVPLIQ